MSENQRFSLEWLAGPDEEFAPDAFDRAIGNSLTIHRPDVSAVEGTLVTAKVAEDGKSAVLTFEVPPGSIPGAVHGPMSAR